MRDLIWEIAKAGDEDLSNTELQSLDEPNDLVIARGISIEAKDSAYGINKFVDVKIANNVEESGALKLGNKVYNYSKSYKTLSIAIQKIQDLKS